MTETLILRGGTVFDGLGAPGCVGDVVVSGGRVREVGPASEVGAREIDCSGLYVTPGFVDPHSHSDLVPMMDEPQPFKLLQGVTTEIAGNCGFSFAPLTESSAEHVRSTFSELVCGVDVRPGTLADFLDAVERHGPTNHMAFLVGHHTLRLTANGADERLRAGAIDEMRSLAAEAFGAGAVGFSTGLIYPPGSARPLRSSHGSSASPDAAFCCPARTRTSRSSTPRVSATTVPTSSPTSPWTASGPWCSAAVWWSMTRRSAANASVTCYEAEPASHSVNRTNALGMTRPAGQRRADGSASALAGTSTLRE